MGRFCFAYFTGDIQIMFFWSNKAQEPAKGGQSSPHAAQDLLLSTDERTQLVSMVVPENTNEHRVSYGAVEHLGSGERFVSKALASLHANVNDLIVRGNGKVSALGFEWGYQRQLEVPVEVSIGDRPEGVEAFFGLEDGQFNLSRNASTEVSVMRRFGSALIVDAASDPGAKNKIYPPETMPPFLKSIFPLKGGEFVGVSGRTRYEGDSLVRDESGPKLIFMAPDADRLAEVQGFGRDSLAALGHGYETFDPEIVAVHGDRERCLLVLSRPNSYKVPGLLIEKRGDELTVLKELPLDYASAAEFSPDGKWLLTEPATGVKEVGCIDLHQIEKNGEVTSKRLELSERAGCREFAFSPDSQRIGAVVGVEGCGSVGSQVKVWNMHAESPQLIVDFVHDLESYAGPCVWRDNDTFIYSDSIIGDGHDSRLDGCHIHALSFKPEAEKEISTAGIDRIWQAALLPDQELLDGFGPRGLMRDPENVIFRHRLPAPVTAAIFGKDESTIIVGLEDGTIGEIERNPYAEYSEFRVLHHKARDSNKFQAEDSALDGLEEVIAEEARLERSRIVQLDRHPTTGAILARTGDDRVLLISRWEEDPESSGFANRSASIQTKLLASDVLEIPGTGRELTFAGFGAGKDTVVKVYFRGKIEVHDAQHLNTSESLISSTKIRPDRYHIAACLTPDKTHLITCSNGGTLSYIKLFARGESGFYPALERLQKFDAGLGAGNLSIDSTGTQLVADSLVFELSAEPGEIFRKQSRLPGLAHGRIRSPASFTPSGDALVTSAGDEVAPWVRVLSLQQKNDRGDPLILAQYRPGREKTPGVVQFSPEGDTLLVVSGDELLLFGEKD